MRKQDLLIVSISTIAAGAVTALAGVAQPLALIGASTLGAMGGSLLVSKSDPLACGSDRQRLQRHLQGLPDQPNDLEPRSPRRRPPSLQSHALARQDLDYGGEHGQSYGRSSMLFPETSPGDHAELTAIFYDIENLLKGYRFSQEFIENISLTAIFQNIQKNESVGMIATQKAYANWSDPRLKVLRNEINELGIDPIQIFGFAQDPTKNAADIQLVIDAVSLTYTNPAIKTVAIISGDGGFASLVKQLREQGKRVIGCAYHDSTSKTFQAVCDDFISLELPTKSKGDRPHPPSNPAAAKNAAPPKMPKVIVTASGLRLTDPVLVDYAQTYPPHADLTTRAEVIEVANEILAFFAQHPFARKALQGSGLNISLFSQAMKYRVEGFNYLKLGFSRLVDFMSSLTEEGEIQLVHRPPSEYRLLLKTATLPDYQKVAPSHREPEVHTRDYYLKLLAKAPPLFKLPVPSVTLQIVHELVAHPEAYQHQLLGTIVEQVQANLRRGTLNPRGGSEGDRPRAGVPEESAPRAHPESDPAPPEPDFHNRRDLPYPITTDTDPGMIHPEVMGPGFVNSESVNPGFVNSESVNSESVNPGFVNSESVNSESVNPGFVNSESVNSESVNPGFVNSESVNSESVNPGFVNSESVNSESVNSESVNSELERSDFDHSVRDNAAPNPEHGENIRELGDADPDVEQLDDAQIPDLATIQNVVLALVMSGCFVRKPQPAANDSSKLAEQTLSLIVPSVGAAIALLRGAVHTKLSSVLEDVNESVLNEIVPFLRDES